MSFGEQTVVLVQIDQPFCVKTWGDAFQSPTPSSSCHAILSASAPRKCFQTIATCPVPEDYNPGTLTLTFSRMQKDIQRHYGFVIPSIVEGGIKTTPAWINLGALDPEVGALGQREVVSITMQDHLWSDHMVDPYRYERATGAAAYGSPPETYDPSTRGTFWGKFLARNPYHSGYRLRVYEGALGDALEDMRVRHYIIDRIDGPSGGQVRITAKDAFSIIEKQKAVAPLASEGSLSANISAAAGSFSVLPSGIGADYDAAGYVAIGHEVIQYTRADDTFTVVQRGALGTTAATHSQEDIVQQVLSFTTQLAHNIIFELICRFTALGSAGSPTASDFIDKSAWDSAASNVTSLYTGRIAKPTPVATLIAELCEQAGMTVWPDVTTGMIELRGLRAGAVSPTVEDSRWIISESLTIRRRVERRASQVWVYYGQVDPTEDLEDKRNFHSVLVGIDADAEDSVQYGVPAVREVFSRWIPQFGRQAAQTCSDRLLSMLRDPPIEVEFSIVRDRDGELQIARYFSLETADLQDETGDVESLALATTALQFSENEIGVKAHSVRFPETASEDSPTIDLREIFIENDINNINLRTIHDSLFVAPVGGEVIRVYVLEDVTVGSTSTATAALTRGTWPAGVQITLYVRGRVQGKGGLGGTASYTTSGHTVVAATAGSNGGPAIDSSAGAMSIDNSTGEIWAGGGGGGAGGGRVVHTSLAGLAGNGGGGAGTNGGPGVSATGSLFDGGSTSNDGTEDAGGDGGVGQLMYFWTGGTNPYGTYAGDGGDGGGPGLDGSAGTAANTAAFVGQGEPWDAFYIDSYAGSPSSGGSKGSYIVGNANVTWLSLGDVRGSVG